MEIAKWNPIKERASKLQKIYSISRPVRYGEIEQNTSKLKMQRVYFDHVLINDRLMPHICL